MKDSDQICTVNEDGHCDHWWEDEGPCCFCGDDTDAGMSDDSPRAHLAAGGSVPEAPKPPDGDRDE